MAVGIVFLITAAALAYNVAQQDGQSWKDTIVPVLAGMLGSVIAICCIGCLLESSPTTPLVVVDPHITGFTGRSSDQETVDIPKTSNKRKILKKLNDNEKAIYMQAVENLEARKYEEAITSIKGLRDSLFKDSSDYLFRLLTEEITYITSRSEKGKEAEQILVKLNQSERQTYQEAVANLVIKEYSTAIIHIKGIRSKHQPDDRGDFQSDEDKKLYFLLTMELGSIYSLQDSLVGNYNAITSYLELAEMLIKDERPEDAQDLIKQIQPEYNRQHYSFGDPHAQEILGPGALERLEKKILQITTGMPEVWLNEYGRIIRTPTSSEEGHSTTA